MGRPRGWAAAATGRPRCGRLAGRRWRGVSIGNGPGRGSRSDCPEAGRVRGHRAGRPAGPGAAGRRPPDRDQRPPGPCPWLHPAHRSTSNASGRAETQSSGASGSWIRPARVWPAECQTGPAGWSACTTPTPGRSAKAGWAGRSSSATKPRSSTTPTGSSWTTPSWSATHPMRRCWPQPSGGSSAVPASHRGWSPPIGLWRAYRRAGAGRPWRGPGRHPTPRPRRCRPPEGRAPAWLPSAGQVAHRLRGPHQLPQAPLRLGPHPHGRHPRDPHLVRPRCVHPQPGQDQRAARGQAPQGSMSAKAPAQASTTTQPAADHLITKRSSGPSKLGQIRERGQLRSIEVRSLAPADG
jgi:hypothetical protein